MIKGVHSTQPVPALDRLTWAYATIFLSSSYFSQQLRMGQLEVSKDDGTVTDTEGPGSISAYAAGEYRCIGFWRLMYIVVVCI